MIRSPITIYNKLQVLRSAILAMIPNYYTYLVIDFLIG